MLSRRTARGEINMSQRLHIGSTKEEFYDCYDCVVEVEDGVREKLQSEWLGMGGGLFFGPWKIRISDKKLYLRIEPIIKKIFKKVGKDYPDDIWTFYCGERQLEYPTEKELHRWLKDE